MGLVEICGQSLTSVFSIADHCFISSEIGGIFGRSRMARDFALAFAGLFRFVFLSFIGEFSVAQGFNPASSILHTGMGLGPPGGRISFGSLRDCTCSSVASGAI